MFLVQILPFGSHNPSMLATIVASRAAKSSFSHLACSYAMKLESVKGKNIGSAVQSNLVMRNFLITIKLFLKGAFNNYVDQF